MKTTISATMQRYTAEIYRLQQDHPIVSLKHLGENIGSSSQAISRMMGRLKNAGLLIHEAYQGMYLTEAGEHAAMPALRRHRLSEVFLVKIMGYDWADAHELTDVFELGVNQDIEDRMDELTDYPTHCPHGEPIPTKNGEITYPNDVCMIDVGSGIEGVITRVRTHDMDKLRYIAEIGVLPGVRFSLLSCAPFQGPLRITINGFDQVIGYELAKELWVEVAS